MTPPCKLWLPGHGLKLVACQLVTKLIDWCCEGMGQKATSQRVSVISLEIIILSLLNQKQWQIQDSNEGGFNMHVCHSKQSLCTLASGGPGLGCNIERLGRDCTQAGKQEFSSLHRYHYWH